MTLPTCNICRATAECQRLVRRAKLIVADGAPASIECNLKAAVLRTAVWGDDALSQPHITLTYTTHVNLPTNIALQKCSTSC